MFCHTYCNFLPSSPPLSQSGPLISSAAKKVYLSHQSDPGMPPALGTQHSPISNTFSLALAFKALHGLAAPDISLPPFLVMSLSVSFYPSPSPPSTVPRSLVPLRETVPFLLHLALPPATYLERQLFRSCLKVHLFGEVSGILEVT